MEELMHNFNKILDEKREVDVIVSDIEWNISKDKYIKPIVKFNEIELNGVKIKQATGFNADYIVKNIIGVGSKITIIRSGDVIPYIKNVITPSTNGKPLMPLLPYEWKGKDIITAAATTLPNNVPLPTSSTPIVDKSLFK